jgi:hypothetical protein
VHDVGMLSARHAQGGRALRGWAKRGRGGCGRHKAILFFHGKTFLLPCQLLMKKMVTFSFYFGHFMQIKQ